MSVSIPKQSLDCCAFLSRISDSSYTSKRRNMENSGGETTHSADLRCRLRWHVFSAPSVTDSTTGWHSWLLFVFFGFYCILYLSIIFTTPPNQIRWRLLVKWRNSGTCATLFCHQDGAPTVLVGYLIVSWLKHARFFL